MNAIAWNIVTGCERLSPGCANCPTYWESQALGTDYHPKMHMERITEPLENKTPSAYMVAAGSDLFHEAIRLEFIQEVFDAMDKANWHQFEVMTKRVERMESLSTRGLIKWPFNVITGVAVEESRYKWRIECLRNIKARRMVMFGPMTGPIGAINLNGIEAAGPMVEDWGPAPREVPYQWVDEVTDQINKQNVRLLTNSWLCEEVY